VEPAGRQLPGGVESPEGIMIRGRSRHSSLPHSFLHREPLSNDGMGKCPIPLPPSSKPEGRVQADAERQPLPGRQGRRRVPGRQRHRAQRRERPVVLLVQPRLQHRLSEAGLRTP
jgi:hypothetical protein